MGLVYLLTNTNNGKVYVGQTGFSLDKRWREHLKLSTSDKPRRQYIHNAIQKHGPEAFARTALATGENQGELDRLEQQYIGQFDSANPAKGYNQSTGGGNGRAGVKISEVTREKLKAAWARKKARGYTPPPTFTTKGRTAWNKGKAWSKKTRGKLMAFWTPERRAERAVSAVNGPLAINLAKGRTSQAYEHRYINRYSSAAFQARQFQAKEATT